MIKLIRAGDLAGWDRSLAAVRDEYGHLPYPWDLLAEVRFPIQSASKITLVADTSLVHDLGKALMTFHNFTARRRQRMWVLKGGAS